MGVVLHAEDTQLQREVALKVIRPELGETPSIRERFLREARAMAQVRSDHVVTIYHVGEVDKVCFLAMELLDGEPLDQWLERNADPSLGDVLRIGREIALSLAAAHARGLVHRDVKPANVWLEGPARRVKLLDFGLARPQVADTHLTNPGMIIGTPMYMAPEQARGESLDGRTDLFSLGCVLYHMLTGHPPFEGRTTMAVLAKLMTESAAPASQLNPRLPTSLVDLLARLLARDPASRPASAEAVAEELRTFGHRGTAPASSPPPRDTRIEPASDVTAPGDFRISEIEDPLASPSAETPSPWETSTPSSASRLRAREAERRQVTLLVCGSELFESEEFLERESEDQAEILRAFQQTCEQAVRRFDGAVLQCNEQGLLACFGFPIAYEDAARRAAEAGLQLIQDFAAREASRRRPAHPAVTPWVGLHTGSAIAEVKEDAVSLVGEVRNVAVRLKDVAVPGRVICTDASYRLFRDKVQCTDIGETKIKGLNRPVKLHRVESIGAGGESRAELSPLTGRDHEISLLKDRWEQVQEGVGQVVFLIGEPGLGKSRLVDTLKSHVFGSMVEGDVDAPVIEWRCSPHYQNTGLRPAVEFYERALNFRPEEPPKDRFERMLSRVEKYGLASPEVVPLWAALLSLPTPDRFPPLSLTPARQREETFRLMVEWLHARAARGPILFIVEDLHWADASTLEFLGQVVFEFQHDSVLVLFSYRPEFKPPWGAADHQTSLSLTRLTKKQVGELVRKKAGDSVSDAVIEQVYDRAGGVPLFVEEFTKMVQDSRALEAMHSRGASGATLLGHEIPSTLQDLITARLDRMEGGRDLAQLASILGREFSHELLVAVADVDDQVLQLDLAKLAQAEILHAKGRPPRCTYVFKHALLEDALYNSLVKAKRQEFHRRVGETLASLFPQTSETQPELLAHHFTEAELTELAVEYWLKAGTRSRDRSAFAEAIAHFTRGLELIATLPESRARDDSELPFLINLAPSYIAAHGYAAPEVGPILDRARALCERRGDTLQQFGIMLGKWEWHIVRGDLRLCAEQATAGVALAETLRDAGVTMEALFMPGVTMFYRGQFAGARPYFERALAEYDDRERTKLWTAYTGHDAGVTHRCYLALTLWHFGYSDQALSLSRETCELARSIGHWFSLEHAVDFAAYLGCCLRISGEAAARADEEVSIAADQGFPFWQALGVIHQGGGLLLQGRHEAALPLLLRGINAFRGSGAEVRLPSYLGMLGDAYTALGRFADAHQAFEEALAVAEKNDDRCCVPELHRLQGELLLAESADRWSDAEACFRRAIEMAREQQSKAWELRATTSMAQLWSRHGRSVEARTALVAVYGSFTEGFSCPDLADAKNLLASLS